MPSNRGLGCGGNQVGGERRSAEIASRWIRRDLGLTRNQAFAASLASAENVIPVCLLDDVLLDSPRLPRKRVAFLPGGLRQLDSELGKRDSCIVLRQGSPDADNGGWRRTAGTGSDGVRCFRSFRPVLQGDEHHPESVFAPSWLPDRVGPPIFRGGPRLALRASPLPVLNGQRRRRSSERRAEKLSDQLPLCG